jgi:hypothetical protein
VKAQRRKVEALELPEASHQYPTIEARFNRQE